MLYEVSGRFEIKSPIIEEDSASPLAKRLKIVVTKSKSSNIVLKQNAVGFKEDSILSEEENYLKLQEHSDFSCVWKGMRSICSKSLGDSHLLCFSSPLGKKLLPTFLNSIC